MWDGKELIISHPKYGDVYLFDKDTLKSMNMQAEMAASVGVSAVGGGPVFLFNGRPTVIVVDAGFPPIVGEGLLGIQGLLGDPADQWEIPALGVMLIEWVSGDYSGGGAPTGIGISFDAGLPTTVVVDSSTTSALLFNFSASAQTVYIYTPDANCADNGGEQFYNLSQVGSIVVLLEEDFETGWGRQFAYTFEFDEDFETGWGREFAYTLALDEDFEDPNW